MSAMGIYGRLLSTEIAVTTVPGAIRKFTNAISGGDIMTVQQQQKQDAGMSKRQIRNPNVTFTV